MNNEPDIPWESQHEQDRDYLQSPSLFKHIKDGRPMTQAEIFAERATAVFMYSTLSLFLLLAIGAAYNIVRWLF